MAGNHSRGRLPKFALQQIFPYYFEGNGVDCNSKFVFDVAKS